MVFKIIISIIITLLLIIIIRYKMEIKRIYKQVDFVKQYETNKMITQSINFQEINVLVDKLNELIDVQRIEMKEYKIKDEKLKQAITNISHDIRTPLTSLSGYFQLLIESDSSEERGRYINIIQTRIDNLKNLLEDMFTFVKIQDSNYKIQEEDCDIVRIVQSNLFSYYEDFKSKGIEPSIDIPEKSIIISSNTVVLDRIINNLISNSLIHGNSYMGVNIFEKSDYVIIVFENDIVVQEGIDIENIFTRFYKKDKARTSNSTGLGLTIVSELVRAMGGKVSANIKDNMFSINIYLKKIDM